MGYYIARLAASGQEKNGHKLLPGKLVRQL